MSRFLPHYSPQDAVANFSAALCGIGVSDAADIVVDGIRAALGGEIAHEG